MREITFGYPSADTVSTICPIPPSVSVADASAGESDGSMPFTVSLNRAWPLAVTVQASTADGTGPDAATAGSDYTALSAQTVTIPAGQTSATVSVPMTADSDV